MTSLKKKQQKQLLLTFDVNANVSSTDLGLPVIDRTTAPGSGG